MDYIEKYEPELIPLLMPVQSPLMCTAIYARNQLSIRDKLAFISPCIAKKMEIADPENKGLVSYNVTFDHLMRYLREHDLNGDPCTDDLPYEMGTIWPILVQVANNLKQGAAENNGVVARLKNDDFLVLFIGKTLDEACPEIRALIEAVESPVTAGNDRFSMTAKLGIVNAEQVKGSTQTPSMNLGYAEMAMRAGTHTDRTTVKLYDDALKAQADEERGIKQMLQEML